MSDSFIVVSSYAISGTTLCVSLRSLRLRTVLQMNGTGRRANKFTRFRHLKGALVQTLAFAFLN